MMRQDLMAASASDVGRLIAAETDPAVLRVLVELERAADVDDYEARADAIELLFEMLVLERGVW